MSELVIAIENPETVVAVETIETLVVVVNEGIRGEDGAPGLPGPPGQSGTGTTAFATQSEVLEGITESKAVSPATLSTALSKTYNQTTPASVWNVTHNLNRYPAVSVVDSAGSVVTGDVEHLSANALQVSFASAFSGTAYLS